MKTFLAAALLALLPASVMATTLQSTFDTDAEGWTLSGGALIHQTTGGNPGGYIRLDDTVGTTMVLTASSAYTGISLLDGGTLSFDFIEQVGGANCCNAGLVTLSGGGATASLDLIAGSPADSWTTYSAVLSAAVWGVSQSTWETLIASISSITIGVESINGIVEENGFDNFSVDTVAPIPVPASLPLLLAGLGVFGLFHRRRRNA